MTTPNFTTVLLVDQTPIEVYNSVNNVRGWWQGAIEGSTENEGDEFIYRMKTFHYSKQKIVEQIPGKKIVWLITDSELTFIKNNNEWTGTTICFDITAANNKTELRFSHIGLYPSIECYGACFNGWSKLIQESLLSLITTGKGKDVF